jgi:hypothetical protein
MTALTSAPASKVKPTAVGALENFLGDRTAAPRIGFSLGSNRFSNHHKWFSSEWLSPKQTPLMVETL